VNYSSFFLGYAEKIRKNVLLNFQEKNYNSEDIGTQTLHATLDTDVYEKFKMK
jgi:hypothetical protein